MSTIRANTILNSAGSGAPDFPKGLTVNGGPVSNDDQILLNRPANHNYYLNSAGVYVANFTGGAVTAELVASAGNISFSGSPTLIPLMSGGTTTACSSGIVSCSVTPAAASNLSRLFDRGTTYFEQYTSNTMTVTVDMGATTTIAAYTIDRFVNDVTYQPRTWSFQGSTDNSTWVTLDSYNSATNWDQDVLARSVSASYRYYRWAFTANNGQPTTGYAIDEISLMGAFGNSTYTSPTFTAVSAPSTAIVKARVNAASAPVSGSTLTFSASRDNGATWTVVPFTLSPTNYFSDSRHFITGQVGISGQPSGTQMKYKVEAPYNAFTSIDAVVMEWE